MSLLDDLTRNLGAEAEVSKPPFDPEASLRLFLAQNESGLDEEGINRLIDIMLNGNDRLLEGYDPERISALLVEWIGQLEGSGNQGQLTIARTKAREARERIKEREIRRGLSETRVEIEGVIVRRAPTKTESEAAGEEPSDSSKKHQIVREAAINHDVPIITMDEADLRTELAKKRNYLSEIAALELAAPGLKPAQTYSFEEQKEDPKFPIVAKKTISSQGDGKYLIEDQTQWEKFLKWVEASKMEDEVNHHWVFQEYLPGPLNRPASLRVMVDCLGNVAATQVLYGAPFDKERKVLKKDRSDVRQKAPEADLEDPKSEFFLNSRSVASNRKYYLVNKEIPARHSWWDPKDGRVWESPTLICTDPKTGQKWYTQADAYTATVHAELGGRITIDFNKGNFEPSPLEREILTGLGFNPDDPRLPKEVETNLRQAAPVFAIKNKEVEALYIGFDLIPDNGEWRFIEANLRPSLTSVRETERQQAEETFPWLVDKIMGRIAKVMQSKKT